jgi:hypothetical protein
MITYPVSIPRNLSRSSNPSRQEKINQYNNLVSILEKAINKAILEQTSQTQRYSYSYFVDKTGIDLKTIEEIGFSIDCGGSGFIAYRPDLPQG